MENNQPRILVVGISTWNSKSGLTWPFILKKHDSNNIANIYVREEIPDSRVCSRYFNISSPRCSGVLLIGVVSI